METNTSHATLGLLMESGSNLDVLNDSELNVSWYLDLDGKIDLQGDSQLVQGAESTLEATSSGTLEKINKVAQIHLPIIIGRLLWA